MDDDQKWLEAAAAIEQDITYLKAAIADAKRNGVPLGLKQEMLQLKAVLGVYQTNAANGVAFPNPDDLFCVSNLSCNPTKTRQGLKASAF
ncbi:MAG: hypothetical protein WA672_14450 [Candidatus Angelobacter sp.]